MCRLGLAVIYVVGVDALGGLAFGCVLISMQSNACRDSRDLQRLQFSFSLYGCVLPDGRPDAVERSNLGYE